jgi:hypothetical protein
VHFAHLSSTSCIDLVLVLRRLRCFGPFPLAQDAGHISSAQRLIVYEGDELDAHADGGATACKEELQVDERFRKSTEEGEHGEGEGLPAGCGIGREACVQDLVEQYRRNVGWSGVSAALS